MASDHSSCRTTTTTTTTKPPPEAEHLPCPRCDSTNTKFCYYNNYNFSQPRHFCKACRRYWTHGGTLRDIPVGGGSRKNAKRSRLMTPTNNNNNLEFRHMAPPVVNTTPILYQHAGGFEFVGDGKLTGVSMSMCESFMSLLNNTQGPVVGFGGFEDGGLGLGLGRGVWPFSDGGGGGGGEGGLSWPDLAI